MKTNTKIIPKPFKELNELPQWAYSYIEWNDVEDSTMETVDGVRMEYDYDEWKRMKYKDGNLWMNKLGLI